MTNLTLSPLSPSPLGSEPQSVSQFRTHEFVFNEADGDQTQTWTIPVGSTIMGWTGWNTNGEWQPGDDDPEFNMGDAAYTSGYAAGLDLTGLQTFDPTVDANFWSGYANPGSYLGISEFYAPSPGVYYENGGMLTASVAPVASDGTGVFRVRVMYFTDAPQAANETPDFRTTTITVTSSQILALADTPVQVLPAPGGGLAVIPVSVIPVTKGGSTPYTISANVKLGPIGTSPTNMQSIPAVLGNGPTGQFAGESYVYGVLPALNDQSDWDNQPILLSIDTNPTAGDFDLLLTVQYMIVPLQ